MSNEPTRPMPSNWQNQPYRPAPGNLAGGGAVPAPRRRKRWPLITTIVVLVLVGLAVGGDRVAAAIAENQMASQIQTQTQQQAGISVKPNVTIEGFPFLTQLLAHDFNTVDISASNIVANSLTIASLNATLHGMHINGSYSGATVDSLTGTALITFQDLANAGGIPQGITLGPGSSPNDIKASISIGPLSTDVTAQVTKVSAEKFQVAVVDAGGVPTEALGSLAKFTVTLPKLPAGMTIQGVSVTQKGVVIAVTASHTTLSQ